MRRAIFEVYAKVVDANGSYNTLSGYPKVFDSRSYDNDVSKTLNRARSEYCSALSGMYTADTRQAQFAMILDASSGLQLDMQYIGAIAELPDPEPAEPED